MVFYRPLDQMYLSTHPPCGFGWIDGHVTSPQPGSLFQRPREAEKRDTGNEVDDDVHNVDASDGGGDGDKNNEETKYND